MNNFNKLKIEIYSKLETPIKISLLQIKLSDAKLNQEISFYENELNDCHIFSKNNPIILERDFFVEEKQSASAFVNQVYFNKVDLHLAKDPL
jgi:hypothetical protein